MTARQFILKRKQFFRTQAAAAKGLGVKVLAVNRWENGVRRVPLYAEIILELLARLAELELQLDLEKASAKAKGHDPH